MEIAAQPVLRLGNEGAPEEGLEVVVGVAVIIGPLPQLHSRQPA